MRFSQQFKQFGIWLDHGGQLLWLRLRMLRLDAVAQVRSVVLLMAAVLVATVAFFLGFISLLFALNSVLAPGSKVVVFFGLAAVFLLVVVGLLWWVMRLWQQQGHFMDDTLAAMSEDMAYLNGRRPNTPFMDKTTTKEPWHD